MLEQVDWRLAPKRHGVGDSQRDQEHLFQLLVSVEVLLEVSRQVAVGLVHWSEEITPQERMVVIPGLHQDGRLGVSWPRHVDHNREPIVLVARVRHEQVLVSDPVDHSLQIF